MSLNNRRCVTVGKHRNGICQIRVMPQSVCSSTGSSSQWPFPEIGGIMLPVVTVVKILCLLLFSEWLFSQYLQGKFPVMLQISQFSFVIKKVWALNTSSSIIPRAGRKALWVCTPNLSWGLFQDSYLHHTHCNETLIKVMLSGWSLIGSMLIIRVLNCEWTPYINATEMVKEVGRRALVVIRGGWVEFFIGFMLSKLENVRLKVKGTVLVEGE